MSYRVLIVDDERLIREGLKGLIDWEAQGFSVAATATDGVEALERIAEAPVDLVVADIRMPRMDGLELLAALRDRGEDVRFLILSGFAEFPYAQKAMALRVDGYLLKPVDEDELVRRLAEVRRQLDATRFSALTLIGGVERVPADYAWGRWQVLLVAPLTAAGQPLTLDPDTDRRFRQACADRGWGEVFYQPPYVGVLLRHVYPRGHNLARLGREVAEGLGPGVPLFAAAVGEAVTEPSAVADSHLQAWALLSQRFFLAPGTIAYPPAESGRTPPRGPAPLTAAPDVTPWAAELSLALESGRADAVRPVLMGAAQAWNDGSEAGVKAAFHRLVSGALASTKRDQDTSWLSELWVQPFLGGLVDFLDARLSAVLERDPIPDSSALVRRMTELIETRYAEPLKLETLAAVFRYNSAYLGKLFRAKTGQTFHEALDRVRIARAQQLLAEGLKVYLVAERVGYRYVDYFHAKFRKLTGVSPSAYRARRESTRDH